MQQVDPYTLLGQTINQATNEKRTLLALIAALAPEETVVTPTDPERLIVTPNDDGTYTIKHQQ